MKKYKLRILHPNTLTRLRLQPVMHMLIGILFLLNGIGIYKTPVPNWGMAVFFLVLGFASIAFPFFMKKFSNIQAANSLTRMIQAFTCFTGCLYFLENKEPLIGLLLLLTGVASAYIGYAEYKIFQPAFARIDTMGITLPTTFSERLIGWNQLNNVVLRDDLLTLDFKNNKVMQLEVLDETGLVTAEEMNAFFKSRL
ncbi:hypothetical protein GO495_24695 [Chitinophaga oryziterrae]|uniref:Uncharacterized protein n=1 Tax=Chitinophaga oryziterrae TaxID=1031224 RepID=A0A6N8JHL5_9BACT|nr:hypothetical protein [Chitinophaga oryziterrae]MVT43816.1 hypothetical protein [Chitinophaga oryziterrae]